jgi:hypothetical protein
LNILLRKYATATMKIVTPRRTRGPVPPPPGKLTNAS